MTLSDAERSLIEHLKAKGVITDEDLEESLRVPE